MNHISEPGHAATPPSFTAKQGQYLAFIHAYTLVLGRPPGRTAWSFRSNAKDSFDANQAVPAASACLSTQSHCHHYSRANLNQSKPL